MNERPKDVRKRLSRLRLPRGATEKHAKIVNDIVGYLSENLSRTGARGADDDRRKTRLDEAWTVCRSGSYYEHTKILKPDEYDYLLACKICPGREFVVLYDADLQNTNASKSFCALRLRSTDSLPPELCSRREKRSDVERFLSPKSYSKWFRDRVVDCLQKGNISKIYNICVEPGNGLSPAVTVKVDTGKGRIGIDLVPALPIKGGRNQPRTGYAKAAKEKLKALNSIRTSTPFLRSTRQSSIRKRMGAFCFVCRFRWSRRV